MIQRMANKRVRPAIKGIKREVLRDKAMQLGITDDEILLRTDWKPIRLDNVMYGKRYDQLYIPDVIMILHILGLDIEDVAHNHRTIEQYDLSLHRMEHEYKCDRQYMIDWTYPERRSVADKAYDLAHPKQEEYHG